MFGKKFFSTVALSGATVSLVGNVVSFAEKHISNIVLTCENSSVDGLKAYPEVNYLDQSAAHGSLILQQLVNCFHLNRSETEQILHRISNPEDVCCYQSLNLAQISVAVRWSGLVVIEKRTKCGSYIVAFFQDKVKEMLETSLDIIKF